MPPLRTAMLLAAVAIAAAAPVRAQDPPRPLPESDPKAWEEVVSAEGHFSILFPGAPVEEIKQVETPSGLLYTNILFLKSAAVYAVYYTEYPYTDHPEPAEGPAREKQAVDSARDRAVKQAKGRVLEEKEFALGGHRGRYLKVLAGNGTTIRSKILMVQDRFYRLAVFSDERGASAERLRSHEEAAAKFLDSFKLLPEERAKPIVADKDTPAVEASPTGEGEVDRLLREGGAGVIISRAGESGPGAASPTRGSAPKQIVSGGVLEAQATYKPLPQYPVIAKAARAQGRVEVKVLVDEEGRVMAAQAASGHPLLRAAAVSAAREARFSPTLLDGKPVKVLGLITYNFVLQ